MVPPAVALVCWNAPITCFGRRAAVGQVSRAWPRWPPCTPAHRVEAGHARDGEEVCLRASVQVLTRSFPRSGVGNAAPALRRPVEAGAGDDYWPLSRRCHVDDAPPFGLISTGDVGGAERCWRWMDGAGFDRRFWSFSFVSVVRLGVKTPFPRWSVGTIKYRNKPFEEFLVIKVRSGGVIFHGPSALVFCDHRSRFCCRSCSTSIFGKIWVDCKDLAQLELTSGCCLSACGHFA